MEESDENTIPINDFVLSSDCKEYVNITPTQRNIKILEIFPPEFYEKLGLPLEEVLLNADLLVNKGTPLLKSIHPESFDKPIELNNKWLAKNAVKIIAAIEEDTKLGGELNSRDYDNRDTEFIKRQAVITHGELVIFGLKMFDVLPEDKKKQILLLNKNRQKTSSKDLDDVVISIWAQYLIMELFDKSDIYKVTLKPVFFFSVVNKLGLLDAIYWVRKFQEDPKFPIWANGFYDVLVGLINFKS